MTKSIRVEVFRPATDTPLEVGKVAFFGEKDFFGIVLARFTPTQRPDEIGYVVEQVPKPVEQP